ncbi:hypothetical protein DDE82_006946 [Stemphylium lycopersici]|nr:hypothetical protein TW65_00376 [Stemphylium lycopersici]RAR00852.1 hypothetical protein DDE82_006946 [Stemphylium lycopersici]
MHFSKISCLSNVHVDKRAFPVAILLVKVIGGQLLAGAAKIAVDATKAHLEAEGTDYKDFDAARKSFTKTLSKDLYEKRVAGVKGVVCFNGPYEFSAGAQYEGPVNVKFVWDIYNTDYDCFEIKSGSSFNKGDGGYINIGYFGTCEKIDDEYRC